MSADYAGVDLDLTLTDFDNLDDALAAVKRAHEVGLRAKLDTREIEVRVSVDLGSDGQNIYDRIKKVQTLLVQVTNANPT